MRLRVFVDWHRLQEREVVVIPPQEAAARRLFEAMHMGDEQGATEDDAVLPVTKMTEFLHVEEVAMRTQQILEYDLPDVSALGEATFEAVSELCGNAVEHGTTMDSRLPRRPPKVCPEPTIPIAGSASRPPSKQR